MAMYYYASKISAIACGTRCRQSVLQKSRGQRDRDKFTDDDDDEDTGPVYRDANGIGGGSDGGLEPQLNVPAGASVFVDGNDGDYNFGDLLATAAANSKTATGSSALCFDLSRDGMRHRRRHSEQSDVYDMLAAFQSSELAAGGKRPYGLYGNGVGAAMDPDVVQYDVPRNVTQLPYSADGALNYENSVVGPGDIVYINGKIISGPLESLIESLLPMSRSDLDKLLGKLLSSVPDCESLDTLVALLDEWTNKFPYDYRDERMMNHVKHIVARCSSTRLEAEVSEILSALLKRLTDLERHEEDLRACQTTAAGDKIPEKALVSQTSSQYAQILCRLEKKLAKHIGPEEFLQCSSYILLDKQKKWDQPTSTGGPPGAQDPKKTCNLETYLDWSARLRLFVCNEILQCAGIRDRSRTVELWSGVAQYCLLVGNYNSATAILETLESPPIARLKITWSNLQVTCQQLDCMQRHAEGHSDLWNKQSSVLNDTHHQTQHHHHQQQSQQHQQHALQQQMQQYQHHHQRSGKKHQQQKTEVTSSFLSSATASASTSANISASPSTATTTTMASATSESQDMLQQQQQLFDAAATSLTDPKGEAIAAITTTSPGTTAAPGPVTTMEPPLPLPPTQSPTGLIMLPVSKATDNMMAATPTQTAHTPAATHEIASAMGGHNEGNNSNNNTSPGGTNLVGGLGESLSNCNINNKKPSLALAGAASSPSSPSSSSSLPGSSCSGTATATVAATQAKPNDWVVIPVFADIVKLALAGREDCLQRLSNGHINIVAFDRMAAIVGAFTKHMHAVKAATEMPPCEYEMFCWHMQKASKLNESELMMASFDCEEPNNAEKLMYDLN